VTDRGQAAEVARRALSLRGEGQRLRREGRFDEAVAAYRRAFETVAGVIPTDELSGLAAELLCDLGDVELERSDGGDAREVYAYAVRLASAVAPGSVRHSRALNGLAVAHARRGDLPAALAAGEQAAAVLAKTAPGSLGHGATLSNLGELYRGSGRLGEARVRLEAAMAVLARHGTDSAEYVGALVNLGLVSRLTGDLEGAEAAYADALVWFDRHQPRSRGRATTLTNIGLIDVLAGRYDRARERFWQAIELLDAIVPDALETALAWNHVANVHIQLGEWPEALERGRRALRIAERAAPESLAVAGILSNLGSTCVALGDRQRALECFARAQKIYDAQAPGVAEAAANLTDLGRLLRDSGDAERARQCLERALAIDEALDPRSRHTAIALLDLGHLERARGDGEGARACFARALTIADPTSDVALGALTALGRVQLEAGHRDEAIDYLARAVQTVERLRLRVQGGSVREAVLAEHAEPHGLLIAARIERGADGDAEAAFDAAERGRARGLLDMLAERDIDVRPRTDEQRDLLAEEHRRQAALAALYRREESGGGSASRIADEEAALDRVRARIRQVFPAYADLRAPALLSLREVAAGLEPDTLLLQYAVTDRGTFRWAVRRNAWHCTRVAADAAELRAHVGAAVGRYQGDGPGTADEQQAQAWLETHLLKAPDAVWHGVTRVVIIPDDVLYHLPFDLPNASGMLADGCAVAYAPSATIFAALRARRRPAKTERGDVVGFGVSAFADGPPSTGRAAPRSGLPALPGVRVELEGIARRFPRSLVCLDGEATEWRVRAEVPRFRYVHFATHAVLDDTNPLYSGLVLAPPAPAQPEGDGFLQAWEMFGLGLDAELVVCSACRTARGRVRRGEGLVGLSRALFFAGAQCVLLSLWDAPDAATTQLMAWLYDGLARGLDVATALRAAKARMRAIEPDPVAWAGFIAVGAAW
jgi:tetratricopeptide (TPR) repeat protein